VSKQRLVTVFLCGDVMTGRGIDQILPHLAAIAILLAASAGISGPESGGSAQVTGPADGAVLIDRLRAMLVQGLAAGRVVEASLEPVSLAGSRATALALVFSELLQNALEHGAGAVRIELARRNGDVVLAIADEGAGPQGAAEGTGLSIVSALVRDELQGSFALLREHGTRAEVVFPA